MKFLFASDSFKGTLSSEQIITLLDAAAKNVFPDCETMGIPVADGGEGTIDAVISVLHGSIHEVDVHGPLMEEVVSRYGETVRLSSRWRRHPDCRWCLSIKEIQGLQRLTERVN